MCLSQATLQSSHLLHAALSYPTHFAALSCCMLLLDTCLVFEQEVEGLEQGLSLLAELTDWAVLAANSGSGTADVAPKALLHQLRSSLQLGLHGGAQGVLQSRPKQLLLWLLEAEHKVSQGPTSMQTCFMLHLSACLGEIDCRLCACVERDIRQTVA